MKELAERGAQSNSQMVKQKHTNKFFNFFHQSDLALVTIMCMKFLTDRCSSSADHVLPLPFPFLLSLSFRYYGCIISLAMLYSESCNLCSCNRSVENRNSDCRRCHRLRINSSLRLARILLVSLCLSYGNISLSCLPLDA